MQLCYLYAEDDWTEAQKFSKAFFNNKFPRYTSKTKSLVLENGPHTMTLLGQAICYNLV